MLIKRYVKPFFSLSLLLPSLLIYLFYRSPKTLVSHYFIKLSSAETHYKTCEYFQENIPLPEWVIFALPEALWIFCISYLSANFYLIDKRFKLIYLPIILVFWFEVSQALHWLNGRFDWLDLSLASAAWFLAYRLTNRQEQQNILRNINPSKSLCIAMYAIVYLAHVMK